MAGVIVSRGQLVEIGGSFRLPEIFEVSGSCARSRHDQQNPPGRLRAGHQPRHGSHPRVMHQQFRIIGFTEEKPRLKASAPWRSGQDRPDRRHRVGRDRGIAGIPEEPTIARGLAAGAGLVLCSGDKLLGGPRPA
ncbi:MAG: hypothetical protein U0800_15650 [Isosphaeraceae bacterium]